MVTIYALRSDEGNAYIGLTKGKLAKRFREHRCLLRSARHKCARLQADWIRLGEQAFYMEILETFLWDFRLETLRAAELRWMDNFAGRGRLYNEHRISFSPPDGASAKAAAMRVANGYRPSAESNLKRSLAQLGVPKGHGAKISATKRAKNR